jgi:hypothetical protein
MGVWAGLPLVLLFIAMIWRAFQYVGNILAELPPDAEREKFLTWCVGSALFAHTATCVSVAYFDQSYIFMFMCLAAAASLRLSVMERGPALELDPVRGQATTPDPA